MKKWILIGFLSLVTSFTSTVFAQNDDFKTAHDIIENWFAAMKSHDMDKAGSYLAPQFTSIHTDGIVRNKAQEMELIKNLNMQKYELTDFMYSQSDDAIVVTYKDKGIEKIDKHNIGPKAAGRMAVLQKQNDQWLILAYANLDTIK